MLWVLSFAVYFYFDGKCCNLLELKEDGGGGRRFNRGSQLGDVFFRLSWFSSKNYGGGCWLLLRSILAIFPAKSVRYYYIFLLRSRLLTYCLGIELNDLQFS